MFYLGIDQHRKQLTVNLRDESGDQVLGRQVSTEWKRVHAFFADLRERSGEEGYAAILEVCGFNDWLLKLLPAYGCREIVLVQPRRPSKTKTDRRDARQLAELLWVNRQRLLAGQRPQGLRRVYIPSDQHRANRQLAGLRCRTGRRLTRVVNRVRGILLKHNLQQDCPTKGIQTKRARRWLIDLQLPEIDRLEMDHCLAQWQLLEPQIDALDRRLSEHLRDCEDAQFLTSIPGAGPYTALLLAASVAGVGRFPHPRSLSNYWGLVPACRNSGDATGRLGSITKEGSALARFVLGQLVLHVLRRSAVVRDWYLRIKRRRGSKIARVAVMRRLATIIWHMLARRQTWQPALEQRSRRKQEQVA